MGLYSMYQKVEDKKLPCSAGRMRVSITAGGGHKALTDSTDLFLLQSKHSKLLEEIATDPLARSGQVKICYF